MKNNVYLTIDNCSSSTNHLFYLNELKNRYSGFKCTIFVPLMMIDTSFLDQMNNTGFLEVACYGFYGRGREFGSINEQQFNNKIDEIETSFSGKYIKGMKCPQFAYIPISYNVLKERDYWIIENQYNKNPLLTGIKYFKYQKSDDSYYFDGHAENNNRDKRGIDQSFEKVIVSIDWLIKQGGIEFKYISESIKIA